SVIMSTLQRPSKPAVEPPPLAAFAALAACASEPARAATRIAAATNRARRPRAPQDFVMIAPFDSYDLILPLSEIELKGPAVHEKMGSGWRPGRNRLRTGAACNPDRRGRAPAR